MVRSPPTALSPHGQIWTTETTTFFCGTATPFQEQTIRVVNQQTTDAVSSVFCLKDSENKAEGYKVQSIAFDDDGNIDVTAIYWPLDENDHSKLKEDFGDAFFTIER